MQRPGIYVIKHVLTGKLYVGQTGSFERRWQQHREALQGGVHHNVRLQELWDGDGPEAFEFNEVEVAPSHLDPTQLQHWLLSRETMLVRTYKKAGIALNIVDPELVETTAYLTHQKVVPSRITTELRSLKPRIDEAQKSLRRLEVKHAEQSKRLADVRHEEGSVIAKVAAMFSRAAREHLTQLERRALEEHESLKALDFAFQREKAQLDQLLQHRRDLHNSYPGNVKRRQRRHRFMF
jgi:GIY-YIG catalytic domain